MSIVNVAFAGTEIQEILELPAGNWDVETRLFKEMLLPERSKPPPEQVQLFWESAVRLLQRNKRTRKGVFVIKLLRWGGKPGISRS